MERCHCTAETKFLLIINRSIYRFDLAVYKGGSNPNVQISFLFLVFLSYK